MWHVSWGQGLNVEKGDGVKRNRESQGIAHLGITVCK